MPRSQSAPTLNDVHERTRALSNAKDAAILQGFFKTGPGEYGEGDRFLGIRVPVLRGLVREFQDLPLADVVELLHSEFHEERLLALLLMVRQYGRGDAAAREAIFRAYLENTRHINNWDLIDLSAEHVVGRHLATAADCALLDRLARSEVLWERRIAILATFHYIKKKDFADALRISEILLGDRHDLIHKAVGWMLREVGKRDLEAEETFLRAHYRDMPRTMLRYAIEKFPEPKRLQYLRGEI